MRHRAVHIVLKLMFVCRHIQLSIPKSNIIPFRLMRSGSTCTMLGVCTVFLWLVSSKYSPLDQHDDDDNPSLTTCSVLSALCCALLDSPTVYCEKEQTDSKKSHPLLGAAVYEDRIAKPDQVFTTF